MMEEIDRFQVPSAVQEAEMQAEMQPLVSPTRRLVSVKDDHSVLGCVSLFKRILFLQDAQCLGPSARNVMMWNRDKSIICHA